MCSTAKGYTLEVCDEHPSKAGKMSLELTYQDVAEHNTKKDIFVVIHDKIYDATKFIDEHPYVFLSPSEADICTGG